MAIPNIKNSGLAFTSNTAIPGSSLTLTKPTGASAPANGDLLLIVVGNDDNTTTAQWDNSSNKPTGFELINEAGNSSSDAHVAAFYRIADGTEGATVAVTAQSSDDYWGYYIVIEGHDQDAPINVIGADDNNGSSSSHAIVGVTTTEDNCLCVCVAASDGGDTYPHTISGTGWVEFSDIQAGTGSGNAAGSISTRGLATAGASGSCTVGLNASDGCSAFQFAILEMQAGIASITPDDFRMDQANIQITITGAGFGGTQGTGSVYLSVSDTLAGSRYLVDIGSAITSWSATEIILNLIYLSKTKLNELQLLGPGARYTIVETDAGSAEYPTTIALHRPPAFTMVPSSLFAPGTTTAQLTPPGAKLTSDMDGGRIEELQNPSTTLTAVTSDNYREDEICFAPTVNARKVSYEFRVVYDGQAPTVISQVPYLTYASESNIKIKSTHFALNTTSSLQDVTIPGLGPASSIKGVLLFGCGATALDTVQADARFSVGGAANTTRFCNTRATGDNLNPVLTSRASDIDDEVIRINSNTGTLLTIVRVDSWIDNGIRLNVDITDGNPYRCFAVFFADTGSDLEITILNSPANGDIPVDITTVGFEPEFLLASTIASTNLLTAGVQGRLAVGFAHNYFGAELVPQVSWLTDAVNGVSPTQTTRWLDSDRVSGRHQLNTNLGKIEVFDFDVNGFSQVGSSTALGVPHIFYFCLTTNGKVPIKVDTYAGPINAGVDFDVNLSSFEPQAVLGIHTAVLGLDSPLKEAGEQSGCFYTFDSDGTQACLGFTEEDNVTTSNAAQWASTNNALHVVADNQASDLLLAGTPTLTPAGFTFPAAEITTADASTRYGMLVAFGMVIEPTATGGEVITVTDALTLTENQVTIGLDLDIQTVVDALILVDGVATIGLDTDIQAVTDALTLTENQVAIGLDTDIQAVTDALSLTENQATIGLDTDIQAVTDALTLTENQVTIDLDTDIQAVTDALTLIENQAVVTFALNIQTILDVLSLAENQAFIDTGFNVQAITDALTLTENQAGITLSTDINTIADSLAITQNAASIDLGAIVNVQAITDALTLTENQAAIDLDVNIQTVADALTLTENQASVDAYLEIIASADALTLTVNQASVLASLEVVTTADTLSITENQAAIGSVTEIVTVIDALTITENQATIELAADIQMVADILILAEYRATISPGGEPGVTTGGGWVTRKPKRRTSKAYDDWLRTVTAAPVQIEDDFFPPEVSAEVETVEYEEDVRQDKSFPIYEVADNLDAEFSDMINVIRFETAKSMIEAKVLQDQLRILEEDEEIIEILLATGMI